MSEMQMEQTAEPTPGLTQMQRVTYTFSAPSKTFQDIERGNKSWWLPFLIVTFCGAILWFAIAKEVTWKTVYENQQRQAPEFARRMVDQMPPERRALMDAVGPRNQEITWALSPLGLLIIELIMALILWPTINFGFGGKAKYASVLAVILYSNMVLWSIRLLLAAIALFAGEAPDGFFISNPAPTNIAAFLSPTDTPKALYILLSALDAPTIWCLILTGIGLSIVAKVKRSSGYIAVFGWWVLVNLVMIGLAVVTG